VDDGLVTIGTPSRVRKAPSHRASALQHEIRDVISFKRNRFGGIVPIRLGMFSLTIGLLVAGGNLEMLIRGNQATGIVVRVA
jgi:hypothetical protein